MANTSAFSDANEGAARWSLRLFGDFQLTERATGEKVALPGKRERVLLAYLALSPNGRQPRRKLVTLLWGEAADETTLDNLRTSVFNLRKALSDTDRRIIASEDRDIVLDVSAFDVDVLAVRRLAGASGGAELEEAAKLCTGDFLEGLSIESEEFESWRREESTRGKGQVLDALTKLVAQLAASGESERAIEAGLRILRLEPLHESAVRHLMRLYAGSGRRATAVELYRTLSDSLKKDLGAQPEAETRSVFADISRGENASRAAAALDAAPAPNPPPLSWPATAGHPGEAGLARRVDTRRLDGPLQAFIRSKWILAGGLTAAAATITLFMTLTPSTGPAPTGQPATVIAATPTSAIALAVLPFANLSADPDQEFFSEGMTEEIVTALARIPDLRVVARSSASQFKGERRDMRAVGQALGATHLIEGSVRKVGTRVRITAQLVKADDGVNVWVNSYDRDLTDVFAIQEEIATAIAGALRTPLGLAAGQRLVSSRSIDAESYQQFLRARQLRRALQDGVPEAIEILEPLVARNPDFAPAWALLASSYQYAGNQAGTALRRRIDEFWPKAEIAARRAIQLDPNNSDAYSALGGLERVRGHLLAADDLLSKALVLDPNNPDTLRLYMIHLSNVGRRTEALAMAQQVRAMEPYVPTFNFQVGEMLWENGQDAAAIELLRSLPDQPPARVSLAMIYASQGRYNEAADSLAALTGTGPNAPPGTARRLRAAEALLRTAPAKVASPQNLPGDLAALSFAYLHVGAPERVLEHYEGTLESGLVGGAGGDIGFLWHSSFAPVRKLERFKTFVSKTGLVEYWRAKGWPEFCRPMGADDFVCE